MLTGAVKLWLLGITMALVGAATAHQFLTVFIGSLTSLDDVVNWMM